MHEFIEFYGKNYIGNNQEVPCLHHIITLRRKTVGGLGVTELRKILGSPIIFLQRLGLLASNLECSWGLPRAIIKSLTQKEGWANVVPPFVRNVHFAELS